MHLIAKDTKCYLNSQNENKKLQSLVKKKFEAL